MAVSYYGRRASLIASERFCHGWFSCESGTQKIKCGSDNIYICDIRAVSYIVTFARFKMVSLFSKTFAVAALIGASAAKDVACAVGGVQQSIVDLDTGSCSFNIPASQPAVWEYSSPQDYSAEFYYAVVDAVRYFTDITAAGRSIVIPARFLYGLGDFPLFQVQSEQSSPSNSTGALRKRFAAIPTLEQRDEESDLVDYLKTLDGTEIPALAFAVEDPAGASSSETSGATTGTGATSTATNTATDIVTITSCSDNVCHETTVPAPTVTVESTTIVTITSCSENKCSKTAVPATWGETTATVEGEVTSYTTWCPLSEGEKTKYVTVTSCHEDKCHATVAPATHGWTTTEIGGEVTSYVTWCPVTETAAPGTTTKAAPTGTATEAATTKTGSPAPGHVTVVLTAPGGEVVTIVTKAPTVAGQSTAVTGAPTVAGHSSSAAHSTAAISTFEASGSFIGASLLSVLLMPLLALI